MEAGRQSALIKGALASDSAASTWNILERSDLSRRLLSSGSDWTNRLEF